jgi:hypothetical protein
MPGGADLTAGVAGIEEPEELGLAAFVEAFVALGEQPPRSVERVVLAAPVAEGLGLDPAADLVETLVGQVRSDRSALPAFPLVGLSSPSPEPDVRLPPHPALHESVPLVRRRG